MTIIALVDDEESILTSVSLALEQDGFEVDTFINGEEALNAFEKKKYDLGLFDIKMPRMTGNELLMKIRSSKNDELKNIWFYVEPSKMEKFTGLNLEKDYYLQTTKSGTNGIPKANQTKVYLRNNHLGYAITWLMIAFGLVGVFFFANVQEIKK